ncbi:MAG: anti-sigma factor antagonist [Myxococcales bacterium]|nr:MAG: anti-sigma factor antagonist [Myxococcales bacterium]
MQIQRDNGGPMAIIRIGEPRVDAAKSGLLKSTLFKTIEEGSTFLGLDMSGVRFIDSSGLGVLVSALKRIGQNGRIALWGLTYEVKALFELTQLYEVFEIFESETDAVAKLKADVAN